jgi:hypothetical protein
MHIHHSFVQENESESETIGLGATQHRGATRASSDALSVGILGQDLSEGDAASGELRGARTFSDPSKPQFLGETVNLDIQDDAPEHSARSVEHLHSPSANRVNLGKEGSSAAASLKARLATLQGSMLLGSVLVDVAPMEGFVDTRALLTLLEFGLALQTHAAVGDQTFSQCAVGH